jgi:tetratricopeptide (TPR) repeat protein
VRLFGYLVLAGGLLRAMPPQTQVFERGVAELNAGDYAAAETDFEQVLRAFPNHVGTLQDLGLVYSRTNRLDQAVAMFRRALELRPDDPSLLLNLGVAYIRRESFGDALPVFQKLGGAPLASSSASDPGLLYLLAAGYLKQNPGPAAEREVETLLNRFPAAPAGLVRCKLEFDNGRFEDSAARCRGVLAADRSFPGAQRELGRALVNQHNPDAEAELAAAVAQDPGDAVAVYYYGTALLQGGRVSEAGAQLERAIRLDPAFWGSNYYLGRIKLQLQQPAQAVPLLRKAAELNPKSSEVLYELGRALMATSQTEEAGRTMQRVRELRAAELQRDAEALRKK